MKLSGKNATVTGGGMGTGRRNVLELEAQGAQVVVADINDEMACTARSARSISW